MATAGMVAEKQKECGVDVTVEEFVESIHIGLVEVVYEWAKGTPFKDVMNLTDVSEGNNINDGVTSNVTIVIDLQLFCYL